MPAHDAFRSLDFSERQIASDDCLDSGKWFQIILFSCLLLVIAIKQGIVNCHTTC